MSKLAIALRGIRCFFALFGFSDNCDLAPGDLPSVTGECPAFVSGDVIFAPSALSETRKAKLWISSAANSLDGPIVIYWHGTSSSPDEAESGIGADQIQAILDLGGMVLAPYASPESTPWPWFRVEGYRMDDMILMDEMIACAGMTVGIDVRRIYTVGFSAGAINAIQAGYLRSNYVAALVSYSGGLVPWMEVPAPQEEDNMYASMVIHGGVTDVAVVQINEISEDYHNAMLAAGHYSTICDHGGGHAIPIDSQPSALQFLLDHAYRDDPDPYASGLPPEFIEYCN